MTSAVSRRLPVIVVAAVLTVTTIGCSRNPPVEGEGRLSPSGRVILTEQGRQPETVARSRSVQTGDTIEVIEGTAKITLAGGEVLELQPRSLLFFNRGPELRGGDMLIMATSPSTRVRAAGSQVAVSGAARVTLSPGLRLVTYQGTASLSSGGRQIEVPALRSAEVPLVGLLPGRPSPLVIDRADPWVTRFLAQAADRQEALESRAQGFNGRLDPASSASARSYRTLLSGLAVQSEFQQDDVKRLGESQPGGGVRAGEVLLGSAVALQGKRGTFGERLAGATEFRAEGASWALVAVDQQVPSLDSLVRLVDEALNSSGIEVAAPPRTAPAPTTSRPPNVPATTTVPAIRPAPTAPTSPTRPPPSRPPPARPPSTPPPPSPLGPLLDATLDPVLALLNDLLSGR